MLTVVGRMFLIISFLFSGLSSVALAQTPDSVLQSILNGLEGGALTLQQAKDYALKNATSVRSAEALYMAAAGTLRKEKGYFDPSFFFSLNYEDLEEPTASFFAGAHNFFNGIKIKTARWNRT